MSQRSRARRRTGRQMVAALGVVRRLQAGRDCPVTIARARQEGVRVHTLFQVASMGSWFLAGDSATHMGILEGIDPKVIQLGIKTRRGLLVWIMF